MSIKIEPFYKLEIQGKTLELVSNDLKDIIGMKPVPKYCVTIANTSFELSQQELDELKSIADKLIPKMGYVPKGAILAVGKKPTIAPKTLKLILDSVTDKEQSIYDIAKITLLGRNTTSKGLNLLYKEGKIMRKRLEIVGHPYMYRLKQIEYKPNHSDIPKIEEVTNPSDFSALTDDRKKRMELIRER